MSYLNDEQRSFNFFDEIPEITDFQPLISEADLVNNNEFPLANMEIPEIEYGDVYIALDHGILTISE